MVGHRYGGPAPLHSPSTSAVGRLRPPPSHTHRHYFELARAHGGSGPQCQLRHAPSVWEIPKVDSGHAPRHAHAHTRHGGPPAGGGCADGRMASAMHLYASRGCAALVCLPYTCAYPTLAPTLHLRLPYTCPPHTRQPRTPAPTLYLYICPTLLHICTAHSHANHTLPHVEMGLISPGNFSVRTKEKHRPPKRETIFSCREVRASS